MCQVRACSGIRPSLNAGGYELSAWGNENEDPPLHTKLVVLRWTSQEALAASCQQYRNNGNDGNMYGYQVSLCVQ